MPDPLLSSFHEPTPWMVGTGSTRSGVPTTIPRMADAVEGVPTCVDRFISPEQSRLEQATHHDPEDEPQYDEAVLGRAVRGSLIALVVVAALGGALFFVLRQGPPPAPEQVTPLPPPDAPIHSPAEAPSVRFIDITREAGLTFTHANGAYGEKLLPETMGGGVAFFDYDGDGDADLLFVNSTWWPWHPLSQGDPPTPALYRNDGGRFTEVTTGSGLDQPFYGMGAAAGDYDNDGLVDLFLTGVGGNRLFHNQGDGRFADVTTPAGVGGTTNDWSTCSTWFDLENDGDLDLFVGNYIRWSPNIDREVGYSLVGLGRAYGQPNDFQGAFPYVFRNEGKGRFTDISAQSGVQIGNPASGVPVAKPLGVAPVDLNADGWTDLVLANDTVQNFVFLNQQDGTFEEIGALAGVAFDSYGNARGAMGIDAAHFRNDPCLGIAIGNFANEMTALYVAQQNLTNFTDEAITERIGPASRLLLKFGIFFFDYDLDGWLDLLSANGHLEDEIHQIQPSQTYAQPAQLFWNAGNAGQIGFIEVTADRAGPDLFRPLVGRGSAYADIDLDGDLDVVLTQVGGPPLLLRNDQATGHHWLRLRLVGTRSNRDALGTIVQLTVGGITQTRTLTPTHSYLSQSELPLTFGLGDVERVDALEIRWPSGAVQKVNVSEVDCDFVVKEATDGLAIIQDR